MRKPSSDTMSRAMAAILANPPPVPTLSQPALTAGAPAEAEAGFAPGAAAVAAVVVDVDVPPPDVA